MPHLGTIIQNFNADTTNGVINFYNYAGNSWIVLFSHPLDFTPVCTTELGGLAIHYHEFSKRNVKLLALSVDDVRNHSSWIIDVKSYQMAHKDNNDFPFPIIADPGRELAVKLDMLDEEGKDDPANAFTVRALYLIDPAKRLRLSMTYPASTGRNISELLRVIDSLQLVDKLKIVATPVNWMPNDTVIIKSAATDEQIQEGFPGGIDTMDMPSRKKYMRMTTKKNSSVIDTKKMSWEDQVALIPRQKTVTDCSEEHMFF